MSRSCGRAPTSTVLGLAVQLCTLPWLGFVPDDVGAAPPVAVARLASRLGIPAGELAGYGRGSRPEPIICGWCAYLGWRTADALALKELDEFLLARAMEHDSPTLLFRLACEYLISARVIRPGPVTLLERVASARARARAGDLRPGRAPAHRGDAPSWTGCWWSTRGRG